MKKKPIKDFETKNNMLFLLSEYKHGGCCVENRLRGARIVERKLESRLVQVAYSKKMLGFIYTGWVKSRLTGVHMKNNIIIKK